MGSSGGRLPAGAGSLAEARRPAKATKVIITQGGRSTRKGMNSVMIPPQVHLRSGSVIKLGEVRVNRLLASITYLANTLEVSQQARLYLKQDGVPPTTT